MAISEVHFRLLCELRDRGTFTPGGSLLEIGEANFYGDFDEQRIIDEKFKETGCMTVLNGEARDFKLARCIYDATIKPAHRDAIDMHGETALKLDLNGSVELDKQYETIINHGTAEHVFNIANIFRVMHDSCAVGGIMIHESPFTGWIDHGFYALQPGLFYDLAHANNYKIERLWVEDITNKKAILVQGREAIGQMNGELPKNAHLFVVFRKLFANPFKIPQQAVYNGTASPEVHRAWQENR